MAKHSEMRLNQSSPYIRQRCPISHRTLSAGDEVLICEQSNTAIAIDAWWQTLPEWDYICPFCRATVERLGNSSTSSAAADTIFKQQKAKPPVYEPSRGNALRTRMQFIGIGALLALVAIVAFSLGQNNPQPVTQNVENSAQQTSVSLTTQSVSPVIATDILTSVPTPSLEMEQLISAIVTPESLSTHTPVPTMLQTPTPQTYATATAEKRETLTAQALAGDSRRRTATAQARITATVERKATLVAQAQATNAAKKRQTATTQARTTATVVSKKTAIAVLTKSVTPQVQVVTPDNFIRNYYNAINQRRYQLTFSLLSTSFKDNYHCCEKNGSYKYDEYVIWWNSVDKVEIQKVKVQELNSNSATVDAILRFHYKDSRIVDDQHLFQLVSDGNAGWLIND